MWSELFATLLLPKLIALWVGAFLGGLASGASGFAFGIFATSIWLHCIEPLHATFLVAAGGLTIQIGTTWPLRHAIERRRIMPFLLAGLIGIPIGVGLLVYTNPRHLRIALGIFLAIYGVYALTAPQIPHFVRGGRAADAVVGFLGGILGGVGGYSGTLPAIWTQLRGWPKDTARAVYQPFIVMAHVVTLLLIGAVALDRTGLVLYVAAVPALLLGAWVGWIIYGRLNEQRFRQAFAALLLVSGVILMF